MELVCKHFWWHLKHSKYLGNILDIYPFPSYGPLAMLHKLQGEEERVSLATTPDPGPGLTNLATSPISRKLLNTVKREKLTFIVYRFTVHPLVIRICISRIFYPPSSQPQQTTGDISRQMLRFKAHRCILRLCVVCPVWSQINFHYLHKMKTDNSFTIGAVCVEIGFNKELFGELGQQGRRGEGGV